MGDGSFVAQSQQSTIRGQITMGSGNVIHPAVTIIAEVRCQLRGSCYEYLQSHSAHSH